MEKKKEILTPTGLKYDINRSNIEDLISQNAEPAVIQESLEGLVLFGAFWSNSEAKALLMMKTGFHSSRRTLQKPVLVLRYQIFGIWPTGQSESQKTFSGTVKCLVLVT